MGFFFFFIFKCCKQLAKFTVTIMEEKIGLEKL